MHLSHVDLTDTDEAVDAMEGFFPGVGLGPAKNPADFTFRLDGYANEHGLALVEIALGGRDMSTRVEDTAGYMVSTALIEGSMVDAGTPIDETQPYVTRAGLRSAYSYAHSRTISLTENAMTEYLRSRPGTMPRGGFRFTGTGPRSAQHAAVWSALATTVRTALTTGLADDPFLGPAMTTMVAEACLACFPNNWTEHDRRTPRVTTAAIRRAVAFIDDHAHEPISVSQIAAAARLSVSALQHAFQAQLGLSPTAYLRQARLASARAALLDGDPADDTRVADIAHAAGFTHLSRFAAAYRAHYGENPSDTLRR